MRHEEEEHEGHENRTVQDFLYWDKNSKTNGLSNNIAGVQQTCSAW